MKFSHDRSTNPTHTQKVCDSCRRRTRSAAAVTSGWLLGASQSDFLLSFLIKEPISIFIFEDILAENCTFSPLFKASCLKTCLEGTRKKNVGGLRGRSQQLAGGVACQGQTLEKVKETCSVSRSRPELLPLLTCCVKVWDFLI